MSEDRYTVVVGGVIIPFLCMERKGEREMMMFVLPEL